MGLLFQLECPGCGYKFKALYFSGRYVISEEKIRERLESGVGDHEAVRLWAALKGFEGVSVDEDYQPFICRECKELFNYPRAVIHWPEGRYVERGGVCPTCGKTVPDCDGIDGKLLMARKNSLRGECRLSCPKCSCLLCKSNGGIWD